MANSSDQQSVDNKPRTHRMAHGANHVADGAVGAVEGVQKNILFLIMQVPSHLRLPLAFLAIGSFTSLGFGVLWMAMVYAHLSTSTPVIAIPLVLSLLAGATLALFYREAAPRSLVEFLVQHYTVRGKPSIAERLGISKPLTYEDQCRKLVKALDNMREPLREFAVLHVRHADEIASEFKMSPDEYTARWKAVTNLLAE